MRRHLRASIRKGAGTAPRDLAHLFGFARTAGDAAGWREAAKSRAPLQAGAVMAAGERATSGSVVRLGHSSEHVEECRRWLAERQRADQAFDRLRATDLATLLELSRARDLAVVARPGGAGEARAIPLLIQGPTGSGKELLARAIHDIWAATSLLHDARFEVVQVAGMPPALILDELFGHARGAFTGADGSRDGRLAAADGGSLLIDEVGDLPPEAQVALLRFLETQTFSRLGENHSRRVNVRILAATWHDLDADVTAGKFRQDLLHRLRVGAALTLPPLVGRARAFEEVVPLLLRDRAHTPASIISQSALDALATHSWPGNMRELAGVLDHAVALAAGTTIRLEHLPHTMQREYLSLPFTARARGFLLDELDEGGLDAEELAWRAEEIRRELSALQLQPGHPQLVGVASFLAKVSDPSEGGATAAKDAQRVVEAEQIQRKAAWAREFWKKLGDRLPPQAARATQVHLSAAVEEGRRAGAELKAAGASPALRGDPWFRVLADVRRLPWVGGDDSVLELIEPLGMAIGALQFFAPAIFARARAAALGGGLRAIRDSLPTILGTEDDDERREASSVKFSERPKAYWQSLRDGHPSIGAAAAAARCDAKTVRTQLKRHQIEPWAGRRRSQT